MVFAVLFWTALVVALVIWILDLPDFGRPLGLPWLVLLTAGLVVTWMTIPWDHHATAQRRALAPAFVAVIFGFCLATSFLWMLPFYAMAVANGVFLFGFRRGIAIAAATPPLVFTGCYVMAGEDLGVGGALFFAGLMVPVAVFMIGICTALVEAVQSRLAAQALVADLDAANAELKRQTERVRELAIAGERTRLAREMHDTLGHYLTAIHLQLQNAERFESDTTRSRQKIREAREATLAALAEVRRSVHALKPAAMEARSGIAAIRALALSFNGLGIVVSFILTGNETELPEDIELALYRATQEGLTNAARHSGATRIAVSLSLNVLDVVLAIRDDGRGSDAAQLENGFGLASLRERFDALGGTLTVGNQAEGGFMLQAIVPVPKRD